MTKSNSPPRLPTGFKLVLYLSVNSEEDFQALELIPRTYFLCKKYQQNLFELTLRVSNGRHPEGIPQMSGRLNEAQLSAITTHKNITTALVCGSPDMNYTVGTALRKLLGEYRVHIL